MSWEGPHLPVAFAHKSSRPPKPAVGSHSVRPWRGRGRQFWWGSNSQYGNCLISSSWNSGTACGTRGSDYWLDSQWGLPVTNQNDQFQWMKPLQSLWQSLSKQCHQVDIPEKYIKTSWLVFAIAIQLSRIDNLQSRRHPMDFLAHATMGLYFLIRLAKINEISSFVAKIVRNEPAMWRAPGDSLTIRQFGTESNSWQASRRL